MRQQRITIAELGGDIDRHRNASELFDDIFTDHTRVHSGTAGNDEDVFQISQRSEDDTALGQVRQSVLYARRDRCFDSRGLLVDLLEHIVRIAALLGAVLVPVGEEQFLFERSAVQGAKFCAAIFQNGDLALFKQIVVLGIFDDGGYVGGDEHLVLPLTDDQRTFAPHRVNGLGTVGENDPQRKGAAQLMERLADTADGVAVIVEVEQLRHNLGIGIGEELVAVVLDQKLLELFVVLDDAVMDDGDPASRVGVRVDVARLAVGRPAGMTDACVTLRLALLLHLLSQISQSALGFGDLDPAVFKHGDACGIISAIFQFCQSRYQHVCTVARSDIAYYSAHKRSPLQIKCQSNLHLSEKDKDAFPVKKIRHLQIFVNDQLSGKPFGDT